MAQMSKTLATIEINVPIEYELRQAVLGDLFTPEAYVWMKKLEFKQMLNRFSVEAPVSQQEQHFQEVTKRQEADKIFALAQKADCVGVQLFSEPLSRTK